MTKHIVLIAQRQQKSYLRRFMLITS